MNCCCCHALELQRNNLTQECHKAVDGTATQSSGIGKQRAFAGCFFRLLAEREASYVPSGAMYSPTTLETSGALAENAPVRLWLKQWVDATEPYVVDFQKWLNVTSHKGSSSKLIHYAMVLGASFGNELWFLMFFPCLFWGWDMYGK